MRLPRSSTHCSLRQLVAFSAMILPVFMHVYGARADEASGVSAAASSSSAAASAPETRTSAPVTEKKEPEKKEPDKPTRASDIPGVQGQLGSQPSLPGAGYAKPSGTPAKSGEFAFGSYGRVIAASDLRGGSGRQSNIVAHGNRIDESSYAELQLERRDRFDLGGTVDTRIISTLAFAGPLFHETGDFSVKMAIRNLYLEEKGAFHKGLSVWAGSRMYRGDDVYLLDWWPLDNLNTVGGGARMAFNLTSPESTSVAVHMGMGRPLDPFSFQTRPSPLPSGFGATDVITLDRPRIVSSLKVTHVQLLRNAPADEPVSGPTPGLKASLYAEYHALSSGNRIVENDVNEALPKDKGFVLGAQIGAFTGERDTYVNLFIRYASGIAAYGDKAIPTALAPDRSATGARELLAAISANFEAGPFGILLGGYARGVRDASGNPFSRNTFNEAAIAVRPHVWIGNYLGLAVDAGFQSLATAAVNDDGSAIRGKVFRLGVIPFITPSGRGSYTRPHLRLIYALTARDDGAKALYAPDDRFARRSTEHFFGIGAEWWFNSSYR